MTHKPTNQVMMVRPVQFRYNEETAVNNSFQTSNNMPDTLIQSKAEQEFDGLVRALETVGIKVLVIQDSSKKDTPDSIFPNNWVSTHRTGEIIVYPMFAENRRDEVRLDIVEHLITTFGFHNVINWADCVDENLFLEATGSLVLDRTEQTAYCCLSERTNLGLAQQWAKLMEYDLVYFDAVDENGKAIYHTNVVMTVANEYAVICLDTIVNIAQREMVIEAIESADKQLVEISIEQMNHFAGNMIELSNQNGESVLVMSQAAYNSLHSDQLKTLSHYSQIVSAPIPTIEKNGGGSVRCMIAEVFVPN